MIRQLQGTKAAKQAALKKELKAKDKALADRESAIKDKEKQITHLQEDIEVSQPTEAMLADLMQQQREVQDDRIQKLIREHAAAREDCRKAEAAVAQAKRDAAAMAERAEEAEHQKDKAM